jgi:HPt (histidine-containing phosphotransfer) domain-containing protein
METEGEHMRTAAPVVDGQVLAVLGEELEDRQALRGFLVQYLGLLDHRLDRALETGDPEAGMDAVLSLKTASAMAGATALSQAAARLQARIDPPPSAAPRWPRPEERTRIRAELRGLARATRHQLDLHLQRITP